MPGRSAEASDSIDEHALTIYVDGSMYGSPRRGGIGIRFVWINAQGDEEWSDETLPATMGATNNQMELEAPSDALQILVRGRSPFDLSLCTKIVIRTDSKYVHDNLSAALYEWPNNRWTKRGGGAVLNVEDWKNLTSLMKRLYRERRLRVHFEWKRGKVGRHAKAVDKLAKQSSNSASFGRRRETIVRRKTTSASVEPGSVKLEGQRLTIRIVEAQYLPRPHRRSRYRYEVADTSSPYEGKVDWAESELALRPSHTYIVRMNDAQENPRIEELIDEVLDDLSSYVDALRAFGRPCAATDVREWIDRERGDSVPVGTVRRRLDRLVQEGQARRTLAREGRRRYVYEPSP